MKWQMQRHKTRALLAIWRIVWMSSVACMTGVGEGVVADGV